MDNTVLKQQDFADAVKYNHSDYELYINIYKNLAAYDLAEPC